MTFTETATHAVFAGYSLPAHDEVFDLAEAAGRALTDLHEYVTKVRTADQADAAVAELLAALSVRDA